MGVQLNLSPIGLSVSFDTIAYRLFSASFNVGAWLGGTDSIKIGLRSEKASPFAMVKPPSQPWFLHRTRSVNPT